MSEEQLLLRDYFSLGKESLKLFVDVRSHELTGICAMTFQPKEAFEPLMEKKDDLILKINCKQITIKTVTCSSVPLRFFYPSLEEQALTNSKLFQRFRDLNSLNAVQRVLPLFTLAHVRKGS